MKNIHLQKTDKPSRLFKDQDSIYNLHGIGVNQHIYITSDEIKERDWFIRDGSIHKCFRVHKTDVEFLTSIDSVYCGSNTFWSKEFCKKIILTTDQDLIKDGVQAIEDSFLEWFVKNPSCEEVEVKKGKMKLNDDGEEYGFPDMSLYKIIIPKEPKQEMPIVNGSYGCTIQTKRRETLEEAAKSYAKIPLHRDVDSEERYFNSDVREYDAFIDGAQWQAEQDKKLYSEEEILEIIALFVNDSPHNTKEWFKKFQKK